MKTSRIIWNGAQPRLLAVLRDAVEHVGRKKAMPSACVETETLFCSVYTLDGRHLGCFLSAVCSCCQRQTLNASSCTVCWAMAIHFNAFPSIYLFVYMSAVNYYLEHSSLHRVVSPGCRGSGTKCGRGGLHSVARPLREANRSAVVSTGENRTQHWEKSCLLLKLGLAHHSADLLEFG